ncbi:MAG: phosphate butyryltransferase [Negativicutes bacterium]|nr:phosphate butyryltransferase [Negativicutes bacterium]
MIKDFSQLLATVQQGIRRKVAVAAAQDDAVLQAVRGAAEQGLADFILVGDGGRIAAEAAKVGLSLDGLTIIEESSDAEAARRAVRLVSGGQADLVMKGMINTADLLRAVLDKEIGLRTGRVLSHCSVFEWRGENPRLLIVTDGGMNIAPDLKQKVDIVTNAVEMASKLGVDKPRVACLAAVETVNPDMPATVDAAMLAKMGERRQIRGATIDGPLALDNALSSEAARHKGITSPVAGAADILLVPDIEAGNILGKAFVYIGGGRLAGLIMGARKPVVLTSRADSFESKIVSIALGTLISG